MTEKKSSKVSSQIWKLKKVTGFKKNKKSQILKIKNITEFFQKWNSIIFMKWQKHILANPATLPGKHAIKGARFPGTLIILLIVFNTITPVFSQIKSSRETKLETQIIALERAGWEAWKNKNVNWFRENTTEECIWINSEGITDKSQMLKSVAADCNVTNVTIDNFEFVMLNDNTVLLTYIAAQDGYCGGKKLTEKIRASVNYIKRQGKWLEAFYMETPVAR